MKTTDIGFYYVSIDTNTSIHLKLPSNNMIGIKNKTIEVYKSEFSVMYYDAVIFIHILEDHAELIIIHSNEKNFDNKTRKVYLGTPIKICGIQLTLHYKCSDENLEDAIYAFKSNALIGYFDIKSLLVSYAKKKGMTNKQAVCHIVTKIDIPEIEGNSQI